MSLFSDAPQSGRTITRGDAQGGSNFQDGKYFLLDTSAAKYPCTLGNKIKGRKVSVDSLGVRWQAVGQRCMLGEAADSNTAPSLINILEVVCYCAKKAL